MKREEKEKRAQRPENIGHSNRVHVTVGGMDRVRVGRVGEPAWAVTVPP